MDQNPDYVYTLKQSSQFKKDLKAVKFDEHKLDELQKVLEHLGYPSRASGNPYQALRQAKEAKINITNGPIFFSMRQPINTHRVSRDTKTVELTKQREESQACLGYPES